MKRKQKIIYKEAVGNVAAAERARVENRDRKTVEIIQWVSERLGTRKEPKWQRELLSTGKTRWIQEEL